MPFSEGVLGVVTSQGKFRNCRIEEFRAFTTSNNLNWYIEAICTFRNRLISFEATLSFDHTGHGQQYLVKSSTIDTKYFLASSE